MANRDRLVVSETGPRGHGNYYVKIGTLYITDLRIIIMGHGDNYKFSCIMFFWSHAKTWNSYVSVSCCSLEGNHIGTEDGIFNFFSA